MSPQGSTRLLAQLVEERGSGLRARTPGLTGFPPSEGQNARTRQLAALPRQATPPWLLHTAWPDIHANTDDAKSRLLSQAEVGRVPFHPKHILT